MCTLGNHRRGIASCLGIIGGPTPSAAPASSAESLAHHAPHAATPHKEMMAVWAAARADTARGASAFDVAHFEVVARIESCEGSKRSLVLFKSV